MTRTGFYADKFRMTALYVLVGVWRHDQMCRPGYYRVIPCFDSQWKVPHFDAVMDDFGNLVAVS